MNVFQSPEAGVEEVINFSTQQIITQTSCRFPEKRDLYFVKAGKPGPSKMAAFIPPEQDEDYVMQLMAVDEVFVFRIPPKPDSRGHRAELWAREF